MEVRLPNDMQQYMPGVLALLTLKLMRTDLDVFVYSHDMKNPCPEFHEGLAYDRHREALTRRIFHRFVRSNRHLLPFIIVSGIVGALESQYIGKEWYSEALDARMIRGDLAIHTLTSDSLITDAIMQMDQGLSREALGRFANAGVFIGSTLREMCEALQALGRFEEAARVYKEIASRWYKDSDAYDKCQLCHYAATAYTRSEDILDGEEQYIAALHWSSRSQPASRWDLGEFTTTRGIDFFRGILYTKPADLLQKDR